MTKVKPLPTLELVQNLLDYDAETGAIKWKVTKGGGVKGEIAGRIVKPSGHSYIQIEINGARYYGHRIAYYLHNKIDPLYDQIDHIDGNGLNNRYNNLRIATSAKNAWNRKIQSNSTSGYKGVSFRRAEGKWQASITCNGKRKYLGYFDTPELAHMAYCKAAAELHGEFARGS